MNNDTGGTTRREFLKSMGGAALGGIILSACGDSSKIASAPELGSVGDGLAGGAALPNGYRFFKITPPKGAALGAIDSLTPGIMLNDRGEIVFYAQNKADGFGLYELTLDLGQSTPAIERSRVIISTGTVLGDGRRVDNIVRADINAQGSIATVFATEGDGTAATARQAISGVYLERGKEEFSPVARFGQGIEGVDARFGGHFGDIALNDNDQLLMAAHYMGDQSPRPGLFHLGAKNAFRLVVNAGAAVPTSQGVIQTFGLVDFNEDGGFVSQTFGDDPQRALRSLEQGDTGATQESFAVVGNVNAPQTFNLAAASTRLAAPVKKSGEVYMGPRVGPRGMTALVTHPSDDTAALWLGEQRVEATGQPSPGGAPVTSISAPVLGKDLLMYYLVSTDRALELCVSNGKERRTILSSGESIGNQRIANIVHGYHSRQVDKSGRIVFFAEFDNGEQAIVLGMPV